METQDFNSRITASIRANEALEKISNIPGWWGVTFSGKAENQHDNFIINMGADAYFNMTVEELILGKRLVWLITDCHMPWYQNKKEWANTRLIFDLKEKKDETEISFTHKGLTPEVECYKDCAPGCTHWIQTSLYSYLTSGQGVFRAPTK